MGLIYADIELINGGHLELVKRGYMDKDEVKRMPVKCTGRCRSICFA